MATQRPEAPPVAIKEEPTLAVVSPDSLSVQSHLDRIVASNEFVRSERMIVFLRYVVAAQLAGQRAALNERSIGRGVFGREEDWDPSIDTIVRTEARRLRQKLHSYYQGAGRNDALRIDMPKGGYGVTFQQQVCPEVPVSDARRPEPPALYEPAPLRSRRLHWLLASAVLALLVLASCWELRPSPPRGLSDDAFEIVPFTTDLGREYSPAISPDGKTVAYVWDKQEGAPDIYLRPVSGNQSRRMAGSDGTRLFPAWSPDGRSIAFLEVEHDEVFVTVRDLATGTERQLSRISKQVGGWADDDSPLVGEAGPVWEADSNAVILWDRPAIPHARGGLFRIDLAGRQTLLTPTAGEDVAVYPRVSPDGKQLAFVRFSSHGVGDIFVTSLGADVAGQRPVRQVTFENHTLRGLAWQKDGRSLVCASNRSGSFQLWQVDLAGRSWHALSTNSSSATEPAISPVGGWLVYVEAQENWNIWRASLKNPQKAAGRFLSSSGRNYDPRYSPDGSHVAYASDRSGTMELWVASASDGENAHQLTHLRAPWLGGINWSPDGKQIAFDARPEGHSVIYRIAAAGGEPQMLERNGFEERMPSWSRDSASLYFNSNRNGNLAIWEKNLVDGTTRQVSPDDMFAAAPTESNLLLTTRAGEFWISDLDGSRAHALPGPLTAAPVMSWFTIGDRLYFSRLAGAGHATFAVKQDSNDYQIFRYEAGRSLMVADIKGVLVPNAPDIAVSPDQSWLLYARQDSSGSDLKLRRALNASTRH